MFKKSNPLIKFIVIPIIVIVIGAILMSIFSGGSGGHHTEIIKSKNINDNATGDTPVETLKTLTSEMTKVEEQNRKLITENQDLKSKSKGEWERWKNDLLDKVKQKIDSQHDISNQEIQQLQQDLKQRIQGVKANTNSGDLIDSVIDTNDGKNHQFIWVDDLDHSSKLVKSSNKDSSMLNDAASILNPSVSNHNEDDNGSNDEKGNENDENNKNNKKSKNKIKPYYTIPKNTILTGAVALQPLIGRIPIDGKVEDPYRFKAVLGPKSIAANNAKIPSNISGIIISGTATGDLLGQCARGTIDSMTFIFPDGRISTTTADNGEHLGEIAGIHGEQCIAGTFHSNALEYLGGTAGLSFLQGYANALSQAQTINSYTPGSAITTVIKNGNKYAIGQGASQAADSAIRWWNQRIQNSFDYIEVSNVNLQTREPLKLNIIINKAIDIDYDLNGRKVFYDFFKNKKNIFTKLD